MSIPVSVCGLIAEATVEPFAWQTAFYWKELVEPVPGVAVDFVRTEIHDEAYVNGHVDAQFLGAVVHPVHVERCSRIDFADIPVDGDAEVVRYPVQELHTVCGIYLDNGETYWDRWISHGPLMAYYDAWSCARNDGRTLLVACVHTGEVERMDGLLFADPACDTEDEMRSVLDELIPTRNT